MGEAVSPAVRRFLRETTIHGGGIEGLVAAAIQQAFRDCHYAQRRDPNREQVRVEAAAWLVGPGAELAQYLAIGPETYRAALELLIPPDLRAYVEQCRAMGRIATAHGYEHRAI